MSAEGFPHLGERFVLLHEAERQAERRRHPAHGPLASRRERTLRDDAGRRVQDQRLDRVSQRGDQRSDGRPATRAGS